MSIFLNFLVTLKVPFEALIGAPYKMSSQKTRPKKTSVHLLQRLFITYFLKKKKRAYGTHGSILIRGSYTSKMPNLATGEVSCLVGKNFSL